MRKRRPSRGASAARDSRTSTARRRSAGSPDFAAVATSASPTSCATSSSVSVARDVSNAARASGAPREWRSTTAAARRTCGASWRRRAAIAARVAPSSIARRTLIPSAPGPCSPHGRSPRSNASSRSAGSRRAPRARRITRAIAGSPSLAASASRRTRSGDGSGIVPRTSARAWRRSAGVAGEATASAAARQASASLRRRPRSAAAAANCASASVPLRAVRSGRNAGWTSSAAAAGLAGAWSVVGVVCASARSRRVVPSAGCAERADGAPGERDGAAPSSRVAIHAAAMHPARTSRPSAAVRAPPRRDRAPSGRVAFIVHRLRRARPKPHRTSAMPRTGAGRGTVGVPRRPSSAWICGSNTLPAPISAVVPPVHAPRAPRRVSGNERQGGGGRAERKPLPHTRFGAPDGRSFRPEPQIERRGVQTSAAPRR